MPSEPAYDQSRASHPFDAALLMARCVLCGVPAAHEVAERLGYNTYQRHAYLCCAHFSWILQDCSESGHAMPAQRNTDS
jgi:hypothetical protein